MAITSDGNEIYFCLTAPRYSYAGIFVTRLIDGRWTDPVVASFSGHLDHSDVEPALSPDGKQLFFYSNRPATADSEGDDDIWVVDRQADGSWSEPRNLGLPVNTEDKEYFPSATADGTLYFCRADPQTRAHQIYRSRQVDGQYQEPELLPAEVNAGRSQFNAWVDPDESRIIVPTVGHPDNHGGVDYWISFRDSNDVWTGPVNLGPVVNDGSGQSWSPYVSPDGKYFFFMSSRLSIGQPTWPETWSSLQSRHLTSGGGRVGMYWMQADFLNDLANGVEIPAPEITVETKTRVDDQAPQFPNLSGPYLGQKAPGLEPELFAPGIVSTGVGERDIMINADGTQIWYGLMDLGVVTIMTTALENGSWTEPVAAPFHKDKDRACFEPCLSADGHSLLFLSNQAALGQAQKAGWGNQNIFRSQWQDGQWTEAEALAPPITSDQAEYFPSLTDEGRLYFSREQARRAAIYVADPEDDGFCDPVKLGPEINCGPNCYNAFVAPDESFLIVCVGGHPENLGPSDYWISFRNDEGQWQPAVNMGPKFNGPKRQASSAFMSRDERYLFFSSNRASQTDYFPEGRLTRNGLMEHYRNPGNGNSDIWWVDAQVLQELKGDTPR